MKNFSQFFLFVLILINPFYLSSNPPCQINEQEKSLLEIFLKGLICKDHFAYTLFADKPVSLSGHFLVTPWQNIVSGCDLGGDFWEKWEIWKRYISKYNIKKYLLLEEISQTHENIKFIIFINKSKFVDCIKQNQQIFNKILNYECDPKILLKKIEAKEITFQAAIKNSEFLWGILLGYGKHNSYLFNRREKIQRLGLKEKEVSLLLRKPKNFSTLEEEKEYLHSLLKPVSYEEIPPFYELVLFPVYFVADLDHPETKYLQKKYSNQQKAISKIYEKKDFFKVTISKLVE